MASAAGVPSTWRLVVRPQQAGARLDQLIAAATPLSRRRARGLIAAGEVRRNGELVRVQGRQLLAGDVIELPALPELAGSAPWVPPPVPLLLDDGWLLAVDKPAGVLSQPAERRRYPERPGTSPAPTPEEDASSVTTVASGSLVSDVAAGLVPARGGDGTAAEPELAMDELVHLRLAWQEGRPPFLRLVHRLDRVTSGVLLFARRPAATAPLAAAWSAGAVDRAYLAVVEGEPPWEEREVEAPIARAAGPGWRFEVAAHGQPAATAIRVRSAAGGVALVDCRLRTGRTHQVRVHLAHLGFPVLGDRLYGARRTAPRPLLHASWLALPHPRSGERVTITAPLPADFAPWLPAG